VYVDRGRPLGFRRHGGKLIAIAGQTVKPLEEAHYEWKTMPEHPSDQSNEVGRVFETIGGVILVVVSVGLVLYLAYLNRDDCGCQSP
jgi:hypothetical protein